MKKLFATLLAATMVAGTAVSAFAYVGIPSGTTSAPGVTSANTDYALQNKAFIAGASVAEGKILNGGDKIYYPILCVDEDDNTNFKYANRASEVDGLKVKLEAVNGGKYIKSTSIVRKDVGALKVVTTPATKAEFTVDLTSLNINTPPAQDDTVTLTINTTTPVTVTSNALTTTDTTPELVAAKFLGKKATIGGVAYTAEVTNAVIKFVADNAGAATAVTDTTTVTLGQIGTVAVSGNITTSAKIDGKPAVTADDQKIYCVEVALADYFGTTDTELDYEISLRTTSVEYNSKDQGGDAPMSFTLGKESDKLIVGTDSIIKRFRNGELTLKIDKDTKSVRLDQVVNNGKDEDVDYIYLEGIDAPVTFDVKASGQDDLFLAVNEDANKKVVLANQDAKMTFVNFPGKPEFDFTGVAKFAVEDPDINYYFYQIVDDKPVKTSATYNKEDECFELRTRTLGSYVISDKELEAADTTEKPTTDKPTTDKPAEEKPVTPTTPGKNVPTGAIA